ncbi:MAG: Gfo/Idh/MocA family protein [Terriglobia bacterium]
MAVTVGVGVIGMGWMGTVHSRSYLMAADRFPDCGAKPRLVICADDVESRAVEARERFGFERHSTRWHDVIDAPDVDVVNITAPNFLHLEIVSAAAQAGKHIFCEKPVGRNPAETAECEAGARRARVLTFVGYNYRWAPLVEYARDLIGQGRLGKITHYRGRFFVGYAANPNGVLSWRFERQSAGWGALGDLMSHVVDMSLMLAGPIRRVVGNQQTFYPRRPLPTPGAGTHFSVATGGPMGDVTNEDYAGLLVEFANGAQGTLEACRVINGPKCQMAFEVNGTKGALSWDFERMNELNLFLPDGNGVHDGYARIVTGPEYPFHARFNPGPGVGLGYEDLKTIEAHQFLKSIAEGRQGQPGFAEALRVAQVLAAVERSWESQSWQEVRSLQSI